MKDPGKYKTDKSFNKARRRLPLGKDDNGKMLYPYDIVRVQIPHETSTSHCSYVYWNALDGAFINSPPAHYSMKLSSYRNLRDYVGKTYAEDTTCVKITRAEFQEWLKEREEKEKKHKEEQNEPI